MTDIARFKIWFGKIEGLRLQKMISEFITDLSMILLEFDDSDRIRAYQKSILSND